MKTTHNKRIAIKAWAAEDRPREKMQAQGRRNLTDAELIAILIRSGSRTESAVDLARRILDQAGNDLNKLARFSLQDFVNGKFQGMGKAKAMSIMAALELGRRRKTVKAKKEDHIRGPRDVYRLMFPLLKDLHHEEFWILVLDSGNNVLSKQMMTKGGRSRTVVDVKIIFEEILAHKAAGVILIHNHPFGEPQPSQDDINVTRRIVEVGRMLEIDVIDHVIVGKKDYYSFADEGDMR